MKAAGFILAFFSLTFQGWSQMPVSNIYIFDLSRKSDTGYVFSRPRFMTHFNGNGYNNHPFFISSEELLIASRQPNESQPDILRISLRDSSLTYLTKTPDGEYSPKTASFENTKDSYYAIRMEFLGQDTLLRLWKMSFDPRQAQYPSRVFPVFKDILNIGYYEFGPGGQIALHLNSSPSGTNALAISQMNMGTASVPSTIANNVGRCFRFLPYPLQLIYLQKNKDSGDMLVAMDLSYSSAPNNTTERQAKALIAPLTGSQDFAVLNDGTLIMASGSRLYKFSPGKDSEWIQISDFSNLGLNQITRIEVNRENNRIILVN